MTSYRLGSPESPHERLDRRNELGVPRHRAMPPLPDLRFEKTYIKSIRPYIHAEYPDGRSDRPYNKTASVEGRAVVEVIRIDWGRVLWITIRDQIFSPFLQGAVW